MKDEEKKDGKNKEQEKGVNSVVSEIREKFGEGIIMKLGDVKHVDIASISTGSISLDLALGIGGIPRGRVVEIYGPESSGKTTLTLHIIANTQRAGGVAAFIDAEHALDPLWAQILGVKLEDLLISQPDSGEQALEIAETLIRSGGVDVIVIDSVAALVPRAELEGDIGDSMMGVQARLMSQALRRLTTVISKSKTVVMFTNQLRQKIGIIFGNPETTPGGLAMKFYASVRLDSRKIESLKDGDKVIGSRHRVRVVKNKVAPPFRIAEFDVMHDGISKEGALIDVGIEFNILSKSGAFIKYGSQMLGQGKEATKMFLRETPKVAKEVSDAIWKIVKSGSLQTKVVMGEEEKE
ncbi:MAG: recombinase RecA [Bacteroidota bacterium]